jgi:hypothetical protein
MPLPDWLPRPEQHVLAPSRAWNWAADREQVQALASLAGDRRSDALRWLEGALPVLVDASHSLANVGAPSAFLHRDVRSDNLRWVGKQLRLFDWPHAGAGPGESDAVEFAQSVAAEDGPAPEQVMASYGERAPVRSDVVDGVVASVAGYLAERAWGPDIPGLPRLRALQRRQLVVTLAWASRCLGLSQPDWLERVPT